MADDTDNSDSADDWAAAMAEQSETESEQAEAKDEVSAEEEYQPAALQNLEDESDGKNMEDVNLDVILDIPVAISLEIGRTGISIRNLLQLNQGSIVELDRLAGEPLDVLVNGTLIAHGEVVVVNEKFGVRLTDIISTSERIKKLK